jgi:probable HAF family extracellular repeat protein
VGTLTGQALFSNPLAPGDNFDAYIYRAGSVRDLGGFPDPGNVNYPATISAGIGINSCGLVTGYSNYGSGTAIVAFLYANGALQNLGTLGGPNSLAEGINAKGHVAGWASTPTTSHAFLYTPEGGMQDIGTLGGAASQAIAINENDQITGSADISGTAPVPSHAFIYSNGAMQDLGTLYGGSSTGASINAAGHVVGGSDLTFRTGSTLTHAFFYSNGVMQDIGAANGGWTFATSINDYDEIVGTATNIDGISNAFIYVNHTMVDLNTLIGSASSKYYLEGAAAINDRGQIAVGGSDLVANHMAVFLLTPLKPSSRELRDTACQ